MEFLLDPSLWVALITLIILEVVLGIDNLVFIAILANKLPPHQRDKARIIGLGLAVILVFNAAANRTRSAHVLLRDGADHEARA